MLAVDKQQGEDVTDAVAVSTANTT
jgi:hypothetical protein